MQLVDIDAITAQAAQTALTRLAQVFGSGIAIPDIGTGAHQTAFGGDDQVRRIRMKRLRDNVFTDLRSVRVRGGDEFDTQLDRALHYAHCRSHIRWRPPDPSTRDPPRTETKPIHRQIGTERNLASSAGMWRLGHIHSVIEQALCLVRSEWASVIYRDERRGHDYTALVFGQGAGPQVG